MKYRIKDYPNLKQKVEEMDVDSLLRAVVCPNIRAGQTLPESTGSVFVHPTTTEKAFETANSINSGSENPSLIVADMEYGAGGAINGAILFPSMWAVAKTGDKNLAYEMGVIAAKEAINAGYHWTFGPCVDILGYTYSPVVTLRTAGDNPDVVIEYCGAYMKGLQDTGLISTLKHFPGDGYCLHDQHVTTAENPLSKDEWDNTFGKVYKTLIEDGAMTIMPGHISLPSYDEIDEKTGVCPPATVSKKLLTELLREKLGFEGIIVSDAVEMSGFCGYMNYYHACAAFLEAGGDCLLFAHATEEFLTAMKQCIADGRLTLEVLKDRAYRMMCFAQEYFENHQVGKKVDFDREKAELTAKEIAEKSVEIVRDRANLLPFNINSDTKIAHVVLYNVWNDDFKPVEELTEKLSAITKNVEEIRDPGPNALLSLATSGEYDLIVCSVLEAPSYGINVSKLCGPSARNMMAGWMKMQTPCVFIGYNTICLGETFKAAIDTLIYTYGYNNYTTDAVVKLLCEK